MTDMITETMDSAAERTRVAIILVRGLGTHIRTSSSAGSGLTSQQTTAAASGYKTLMPTGERRLVDYSLSALVDIGIERAVLVTGPEHEDFRRHIDSLEFTRLMIDPAVQANPLGTADAALSAEIAIGGEPFLMVNGGNYYPRQVLRGPTRHRGNAPAGFGRVALAAESNIPAERIAAFALVRTRDGTLEEIAEKPPAEVVQAAGPHALVSMNAFQFTPGIFAVRRRTTLSPHGELGVVDAARALLDPASVLPVAGGVLDLSRCEDTVGVEAHLPETAVPL